MILGAAAGTVAAVALSRRFARVEVVGVSMLPALEPGDYVVVDRRAFGHRLPRPGEVVVALEPRADLAVVKRVAVVDPARGAWLIGDNAEHSTDSRDFGWVAASRITGRVALRYWPWRRTAPFTVTPGRR
jgi:nickel-type superoxide dismutase maturation protease